MKAELQGWCGSACAGKFLAGTVEWRKRANLRLFAAAQRGAAAM